jgi:multiple sugar transport system permease protein
MNLSQKQEASTGLLFILPAFLVIIVFQIFPMFYALDLSFFKWDMITKKTFAGLRNYANLFSEPSFWKSLGVTFYYVAVSIPFGLGLSLLFAVLLDKGIKGLGFFRTAFFLPYITSIAAIAMVWLWIYNPNPFGLLNSVLGWFHVRPQKWLQSPVLAMPAMILMLIWKNLGFNIIIFLTRLQNINKSYYEAAEIDGASKWQQFRFITFPLLGPTTIFLLTMSVIYAFQVFTSIYVMTPDGGPKDATTTIVFYLYKNAYEQFNMGYASAVAYVTFFIILGITLLQRRLTKGVAES